MLLGKPQCLECSTDVQGFQNGPSCGALRLAARMGFSAYLFLGPGPAG
uniref:Uncharacterized protein n=1 Tax=Rhizophora mucronata TaxID=61149 RepID=A0A2P2NNK2_RHIMU